MMKKSRYSETRIVRILKEVEAGRLVKKVCHGQDYESSCPTRTSSR
ncbi:hypothetical protein CI610_02971 [invertebrate metagenome]|uniref:Transposase n=1 Tax=invertebrate metagenome TaxID=1711999 RepID=A0A2H9T4E9_9ZZZZ